MKQNIIFFWFNLSYEHIGIVEHFCKEYGFIELWQKGNGWSIGVFEDELETEKAQEILTYAEKLNIKILKQSKSRNDVQAKNKLRAWRVSELDAINFELSKERKRKNKKLPKFLIDDIFTKSIIREIEEKYRYIFTDEEIEKEDEKLLYYIKSFPYLEEHLLTD